MEVHGSEYHFLTIETDRVDASIFVVEFDNCNRKRALNRVFALRWVISVPDADFAEVPPMILIPGKQVRAATNLKGCIERIGPLRVEAMNRHCARLAENLKLHSSRQY